ncbi:MAG: lecithin retinol acyltransferase family protein [Desulfobacterales bacterium]|nr:MAG: lecithin retinol acyltransferase family protein [Desulfobacterales bacterium]
MRLIEEDLKYGDHIYVRRKGLFYSHHGIYAGKGTVIHFKGAVKEKKDPVVIKTDIESFLNGGKLKRRDYKKRLPHVETLGIAKEHLSKKGYSLAFNNCEHFAAYCATGKKKSVQVHNVVGVIVGATLAIAAFIGKKRTRTKEV